MQLYSQNLVEHRVLDDAAVLFIRKLEHVSGYSLSSSFPSHSLHPPLLLIHTNNAPL